MTTDVKDLTKTEVNGVTFQVQHVRRVHMEVKREHKFYTVSLTVTFKNTKVYWMDAKKTLEYNLAVWQFGKNLYAWSLDSKEGTIIRRGGNGANGEKYTGMSATWRDAIEQVSLWLKNQHNL